MRLPITTFTLGFSNNLTNGKEEFFRVFMSMCKDFIDAIPNVFDKKNLINILA